MMTSLTYSSEKAATVLTTLVGHFKNCRHFLIRLFIIIEIDSQINIIFFLMGFSIENLQNSSSQTQKSKEIDQQQSQSAKSANLFRYYEQLIKQTAQKHEDASSKLSLSLIMGRGSRGSHTGNRDLALLDIDKMISFKNASLKEGDQMVKNMRMAIDVANLNLRNPTVRVQHNQRATESQNVPTRNFQIFRLVRAAQNHYLEAERRANNQPQQQDLEVNTSLNFEE